MTELKSCKDCDWHRLGAYSQDKCYHPIAKITDAKDTILNRDMYMTCIDMRTTRCGTLGDLFIKKGEH